MLDVEYGLTKKHLASVRRTVCRAFKQWNVSHPKIVTKSQIRIFQQSLKGRNGGEMVGKGQSVLMSYLNGFFLHCGVSTIQGMRFRFPKNNGKNRTWLNEIQIAQLEELELPPLKALIIHLNKDLAFRCCDITSVLLDDVKEYPDGPGFDFTSKGKKDRIVPFHDDTQRYLDDWLMEREKIISEHPKNKDPGNIVIIYRHHKIKSPGPTWFSDRYKEINKQVGFYFRYHTLRRTWGRVAYDSDVKIDTIKDVLGHDDRDDTLGYIGINVKHMREALGKVRDYKNLNNPIKNNNKIEVVGNGRKKT
jgi:integrase